MLRPNRTEQEQMECPKREGKKMHIYNICLLLMSTSVLHNFACHIELPSWVPRIHLGNTPKRSFSSLAEKAALYSNLCGLGVLFSLLGIQGHLQPHCTGAQSPLYLTCPPLEGMTLASRQPFICHLHPALGSCLPAG